MRALAVILAIGIVLMTESAISQSKLAATPTSGAPPLVVDFTGAGSGAAEGVMVLDFGANTITDFNVHTDAIQFDASLFANAAAILASTTDSAGGAVITDAAGDTLTLAGVTTASLAAHSSVFLLA